MKKYYLPRKFKGAVSKHSGTITKTPSRKWTVEEIKWMLWLRKEGCSNKDIAVYLGRSLVSVGLKIKRVAKKDGKTYNKKHRERKYKTNALFLNEIKPKSVLDLYSGEESYYNGKVRHLETNDINEKFNTDYNEDAEKLILRLYLLNRKYDLIDIDPFGSGYECFTTGVKMARKGIILTLGEMGHQRFKRLDFVRPHYGITSLKNFTSQKIVDELIKIGLIYKKKLTPMYIENWQLISRVYFKIEKIKITEQWERKK